MLLLGEIEAEVLVEGEMLLDGEPPKDGLGEIDGLTDTLFELLGLVEADGDFDALTLLEGL